MGIRGINLNSGTWNQFLGKDFPSLLHHSGCKHLVTCQNYMGQVKQCQSHCFIINDKVLIISNAMTPFPILHLKCTIYQTVWNLGPLRCLLNFSCTQTSMGCFLCYLEYTLKEQHRLSWMSGRKEEHSFRMKSESRNSNILGS